MNLQNTTDSQTKRTGLWLPSGRGVGRDDGSPGLADANWHIEHGYTTGMGNCVQSSVINQEKKVKKNIYLYN